MAATADPVPPTPPPRDTRVPRILVADDNIQGAELLDAYLSVGDHEVRIARDGEETWQQVKEWHPDLILLDVMMPKISGFEVCKRLRADPATKNIAVIMITALDQFSDIERAVEAGTNDFLTKPINKHDLLDRVEKMLASRRRNQGELEQVLDYIESVERGGA